MIEINLVKEGEKKIVVIGKPKILIVDDDPECRNTLSLIFSNRHFSTSVASDGTRGFETMKSFKPDVALLDMMMPGIDGISLTKKAKSDPETKEIQIIMISAKTDSEEIESAFNAGAVDYITKPFVSAEVIARTRTALRKKAMLTEKLKQKRLSLFHTDVVFIARELQRPMALITTALGKLKNEWICPHTEHYQNIIASYDHSIRLQVILRELQKIHDLDVEDIKL